MVVDLPGMRPQGLALSPDGKILVTAGKTHELVVLDPEAGWICLPLAINDPQFRLRTPGAITDPAKDMIEGGNFAFFWTQGGVSVCDPAGRGGVLDPLPSPSRILQRPWNIPGFACRGIPDHRHLAVRDRRGRGRRARAALSCCQATHR